MTLELVRRSNSLNWYLRGAVRGISVFESTKVAGRCAAEAARIFREKELFEESLLGRKVKVKVKVNVTFDKAAQSYHRAGGTKRFLERIRQSAGSKLLRKLRQNDLDVLEHTLYPSASPETRNRQCYTPHQIASEYGGQLSNSIVTTRRQFAAKGKIISDVSLYTARHSVSTQLVVNGVHPHIKDQTLGHAADNMSRRHTAVPRAPFMDAINPLPVPERWRTLPWWSDPLAFSRNHVKWGKK